MYSLACFLALQLVGPSASAPDWNRDYDLALRRAEAAKKPLAVIVGTGREGWKAACEDGDLGPEVRRLLADHYVCLYVDASQAAEQELVQSFEAGRAPLVVLSTRDRAYQAYRHSGPQANASLARALRRHATEETASPSPPSPPATAVYYEAPCRT